MLNGGPLSAEAPCVSFDDSVHWGVPEQGNKWKRPPRLHSDKFKVSFFLLL